MRRFRLRSLLRPHATTRRATFVVIAAGALTAAGAPCTLRAQAAAPAHDAIRQADLRADLFTLAGDGFRGREAGTLDELRASMWIAEQLRTIGLEPAGEDGSYFQWWPIQRTRVAARSRVAIDGTPLTLGRDAAITRPTDADVDLPLVWLGDAAPATLDSADVAGRAVAIRLRTRPDAPQLAMSLGGWRVTLRAVRQQAQPLIAAGAAAVVLVSDSLTDANFDIVATTMTRGSYGLGGGALPARPAAPAPPVVWLRRAAGERLATGTHRLVVQTNVETFTYPSVNIVARVPGTDSARAREHVLFSAHQDHDGVRRPQAGDSTWNGADDNGTVAVALLAIARAWKQAPAARSALFVWHGAEERGLLGSRWFVEHPTVPREDIVAVLNADMIGRNHPDSAALLGAQPPHRNSRALADLALAANTEVIGFALDTLWDRPMHPENWYFRSDHLPYARAGVPALMFTTLLHDDYHTPRDGPERIDYAKLTRMTRWMYETGWRVATAAERVRKDPEARLERE